MVAHPSATSFFIAERCTGDNFIERRASPTLGATLLMARSGTLRHKIDEQAVQKRVDGAAEGAVAKIDPWRPERHVAATRIGDDVQIGPNVQLLSPTHPVEPGPRRDRWEAAEPITIGDNVWLGGGAIVLPGVTIGDNTFVGAGAVATKDLPANVVAVGNPAPVVRTLASPDPEPAGTDVI